MDCGCSQGESVINRMPQRTPSFSRVLAGQVRNLLKVAQNDPTITSATRPLQVGAAICALLSYAEAVGASYNHKTLCVLRQQSKNKTNPSFKYLLPHFLHSIERVLFPRSFN
jgi:hypothetical protein